MFLLHFQSLSFLDGSLRNCPILLLLPFGLLFFLLPLGLVPKFHQLLHKFLGVTGGLLLIHLLLVGLDFIVVIEIKLNIIPIFTVLFIVDRRLDLVYDLIVEFLLRYYREHVFVQGFFVSFYHRVKFVLYRVLVTGIIEDLDQVRPLFAMVSDKFEHFYVLFPAPHPFYLGGVEMVVPAFPALLGGPEALFIGTLEQLLGDLVPLDFGIFGLVGAHDLFQHILLHVAPVLALVLQVQAVALVLEQFGVLAVEYFLKVLPVLVPLTIKPAHYHMLYFLGVQVAVADHNPHKKPQLIFEPVAAFHVMVFLVESKGIRHGILGVDGVVQLQCLVRGDVVDAVGLDAVHLLGRPDARRNCFVSFNCFQKLAENLVPLHIILLFLTGFSPTYHHKLALTLAIWRSSAAGSRLLILFLCFSAYKKQLME